MELIFHVYEVIKCITESGVIATVVLNIPATVLTRNLCSYIDMHVHANSHPNPHCKL